MPSSFGLYRCNATGTTDRDSWFESGTGIALCPAFFCLLGDFYLTLRSLMSPGKSSPVIRMGLFLTGDQSHDGGRGEPSKTGVHSTLLFVPLNCASLVCGTGKFICHVKKYGVQSTPSCCAASAVAEAMAGQAASQARLPHGGICFTRIVRQTNSVQLRRTNKSALWAGGTGDCVCRRVDTSDSGESTLKACGSIAYGVAHRSQETPQHMHAEGVREVL